MKCELSSDRERGPGHGILTVSGLPAHASPLGFVLMRNQGTEPYLGPDGNWQGNEVLLTTPEANTDGDSSFARVGPELVDAIVALSSNVAFRLSVVTENGKAHGTLKINHPLFGSSAAAPKPPAPPPEPPAPPPIDPPAPLPEAPESIESPGEVEGSPTDDTPALEPLDPESSANSEHQPRRGKLSRVAVVGLFLLLAAAGAYYAWFACLIAGFGPAVCTEEPSPPEIANVTPEPAPTADQANGGTSPPGGESSPLRTCKGLDLAQCVAAAQSAARASDLELARQLYQQGARMGSTEAMLRVGEMYDPDTWTAETSPETEPDWETAAYWYESAAQLGASDGLVRAGRLLCGHAQSALEIQRGVGFLEQAIAKGSTDEARALLSNCKSTQP